MPEQKAATPNYEEGGHPLADAAMRTWRGRRARTCVAISPRSAQNGDAAIRDLTERIDGRRQSALVFGPPTREARRRRAGRHGARRPRERRRPHRALPRAPARQRLPLRAKAASTLGMRVRPLRARRRLRAGRQGALSVDRADDGDPGARRRRARHRPGHADARRRDVLAAAHLAGVTGVLDAGGAQAIARARLRHRVRPARRQDRRPRQPLRRRAPSGWCSAWSRSTASPGRARSWSSPTTSADPAWSRPTCSRRPSTTRPRTRCWSPLAELAEAVDARSTRAARELPAARDRRRVR